MGGEPYWYFVDHQPSVQAALDALREREFRAGRYNPVVPFPDFPPGPGSAAPGAKHRSIRAALEAADADGTRSILDIDRVGPSPDYGVAAPLPAPSIQALYGTAQPTRAMVEGLDFLEDIERGQCVYLVIYADGKPSEILFAGYSYD